MPTIKDFGGFKIVMYFHDRHLPHVHVVSTDFEALVSIAEGVIYDGSIPPKYRRTALEWIEENRMMLLAKWEQLQ